MISKPNGLTRRAMLQATAGAALVAPAFGKMSGIDLGVCGNPKDFSKTAQYGYDYFEPSAASLAAMNDTDWAAFRDQVKAAPVKCTSDNILFSRGQRVVGADVNLDEIMKYVETTFDRCKAVGAEVVVWGSSGSRNVQEGYSRDTAWKQIVEFLKRLGPVAKAKGIVIGIEPLRHQESNIINTGAEALKLLTEVNHPQIQMIIDFYHMRIENEDPEIVRTAKDHIVHMHFANPNGRKWPHSPDEDPVYGKFFEIVKAVGYNRGLSIEGTGTFEADGAASLEFFKHFLG